MPENPGLLSLFTDSIVASHPDLRSAIIAAARGMDSTIRPLWFRFHRPEGHSPTNFRRQQGHSPSIPCGSAMKADGWGIVMIALNANGSR